MQKKKRFLFISECKVSSAKPKIQKNERNAKEKTFSFFYSLTQQGRFRCVLDCQINMLVLKHVFYRI